jgi:hypothetical protein
MRVRTFTVRLYLSHLGLDRANVPALHTAYKFLDPDMYGGKVAGYVFGVLIGECVIFSIVWGLAKLRNKIFAKRRIPILSSGEKVQTGQV